MKTKIKILDNGFLYFDNNHQVKITFNLTKDSEIVKKNKTSLFIKKFNNEDDIELLVDDNKVKENIIIHQQKDIYKYLYNLEISNLILEEKNNQYFFLDKKTKKEVFKLSEFIMFDSNNKESKNIKVKLNKIDENNYILKVTPSKQWINSLKRKFPIILDPSIETISMDCFIFNNSYSQSYVDKTGYAKVGFVSSKSYNLAINIDLSGIMNEIERRGKSSSNFEVILKLPYQKRYGNSDYILTNGSFNAKCQMNNSFVLTFNITKIVKQLFQGSVRTTKFTLSNAKSSFEGRDCIDVCTRLINGSKPSLILNYELDDSPFETTKDFIQDAGTTFFNVGNGQFIHKKNIGKINHNALSLPIDLILNSNLLFSRSVDTRNKCLTKGWKTSLHQYIIKIGGFIDPLKTNTIHYIDGDGFTHLLLERWYYQETKGKVYVEKSKIFYEENGTPFVLVGTNHQEVQFEYRNEEGLIFIGDVSEDKVHDILLDTSNNLLGFDKFGRLILVQDGYGNSIDIVYGSGNDRDKILSVESKLEKIKFEYDDNNFLCRIIDQFGRVVKLNNGSTNGYSSLSLTINDNQYQFINSNNIFYINDIYGKVIRLYIDSSKKVNKIEEYFTGEIDEINDPFSGTMSKGNVFTYTFENGLTTENITKIHNNQYQKTNLYQFDSAGRLIKSVDHKNNYVISDYDGQYCLGKYSFNKKTDLIKDIKESGFSTSLEIEKEDNITGFFAYVIEHTDSLENKKSIEFNFDILNENETLLKNVSQTFYEYKNTIVCTFIVPKGQKIILRSNNSTTLENITSMFITRINGHKYSYDKNNHLIKSINGLSEITYSDYQNDNPTIVTTLDIEHKETMVSKFNYDANNNLTYQEDYLGNINEYEYNGLGQLLVIKVYNKKEPTLCLKQRYEYDENGNVINLDGVLKDKNGLVPSTEIKYTRGLKAKVISPSKTVINYGYDFNTNQLLSISSDVDGINSVNRFNYKRNLLTSIEHDGFKVDYKYDKQGRRTSILINDNEYVNTEYDDNFTLQEENVYFGSKITNTFNNGFVSSKIYDIDGYLKREYKDSYYKSYTYDKNDNITNIKCSDSFVNKIYEYDKYNNVISEVDSSRYSKTFAYDTRNRLIKETNSYNSHKLNYNYIYDENNKSLLEKVNLSVDDFLIDKEFKYDSLNRINSQNLKLNNNEFIKDEYEYLTSEDNALSLIKEHNVLFKENTIETNSYEYDINGNIIKVITNEEETRYHYDSLNRLIREDNPLLDKTIVYKYDKRGNILLRKEYKYSLDNDLFDPLNVDTFLYKKDSLNDQLIKYNDKNFIYDDMGRPTTYKGMDVRWNKDGTLYNFDNRYSYIRRNFDGMFFERRINRHPYDMFFTILDGNRILSDNKLTFIYILERLVGFIYNGARYFYQRNIQGDITAIYDEDGNLVNKYVYDAYGRHKVLTSTLEEDLDESSVGNLNPFRYRGYYYDRILGLYFLTSRYYDPEIGRFISPDSLEYLDPENVNGLNLYSYCNNDPVNYSDGSGHMPEWAQFVLGGLIIVGGIALSIATGGLATPLVTTFGGGLIASMTAGAIVGALGGTIAGACFSIGSQVISSGFDNIQWLDVGKSALSGFISGLISGGIFSGIKYAVNTNQIANSLAGVKLAQTRLDNAFLPLKNVENLSKLPFSSSNIARTVSQVAINYNNAYSNLIIAQINSKLIELAIKGGLSGLQFGLKKLIGYGLNQIL